jgi:hypothetical protein
LKVCIYYLCSTAKYDWNHVIYTTLLNWDTQCEEQQYEMPFEDSSLTCLCKIKP